MGTLSAQYAYQGYNQAFGEYRSKVGENVLASLGGSVPSYAEVRSRELLMQGTMIGLGRAVHAGIDVTWGPATRAVNALVEKRLGTIGVPKGVMGGVGNINISATQKTAERLKDSLKTRQQKIYSNLEILQNEINSTQNIVTSNSQTINKSVVNKSQKTITSNIETVENNIVKEKKLRGAANPKIRKTIEQGKKFDKQFKERVRAKKGWIADPQHLIDPLTKHKVIPDALTPSGNPIELKPRTPSGIKKGKEQIKKYERTTGKKGKVVYYDPE
ncbi:MAG: hypothetical protein LN566_05020 [Rickettsia endosymbiont of Stiretrus anchorago]|nr:hypothetical protein [Rickettsia endosymbiont of Stiretrus anchorago]